MELVSINIQLDAPESVGRAFDAMANQIGLLARNVEALSLIVGLGLSLADNPQFRKKSVSDAFVKAIEVVESGNFACDNPDMVKHGLQIGATWTDPDGGREKVVRLFERVNAKAA